MEEQITREQIINDLKKTAENVESTLTSREYEEQGEYSVYQVKKKFESWSSGKEAAGLNTSNIPDQELIEDLKRVAEKIGESPTRERYEEHGKYSASTLVYHFGSWNKAKKEAGLETLRGGFDPKITVEELVEELENGLNFKEIADKYGMSVESASSVLGDKLKRAGYFIRSRLAKNSAAYAGNRFSGLLSIPASILDKIGVEDVEQTYYDITVIETESDGPDSLRIDFAESKVGEIPGQDSEVFDQ